MQKCVLLLQSYNYWLLILSLRTKIFHCVTTSRIWALFNWLNITKLLNLERFLWLLIYLNGLNRLRTSMQKTILANRNAWTISQIELLLRILRRIILNAINPRYNPTQVVFSVFYHVFVWLSWVLVTNRLTVLAILELLAVFALGTSDLFPALSEWKSVRMALDWV